MLPHISSLLALLFLSSYSAWASSLVTHALQAGRSFGCEVSGVQVRALSAEELDQLHRAFLRCRVLVVRDQKGLTVEEQRRFSQRFGTLHVHLESASHYDGYPDVNLVSNIRNAQGNYVGLYGKHVELYHTDLSW